MVEAIAVLVAFVVGAVSGLVVGYKRRVKMERTLLRIYKTRARLQAAIDEF